MDLDIDVARLRLLKADHQAQQYRLEDNLLQYFPKQIEQNRGFIAGLKAIWKRWPPIHTRRMDLPEW